MKQEEYRELCTKTGHSPEELAALLGIGRATLFRRWNGSAPITAEMELAIRAVKAKQPTRKALQEIYGLTPISIEAPFEKWVQRKYPKVAKSR